MNPLPLYSLCKIATIRSVLYLQIRGEPKPLIGWNSTHSLKLAGKYTKKQYLPAELAQAFDDLTDILTDHGHV